jgi:antitoxin component of MazEF toxin-antitoxin module
VEYVRKTFREGNSLVVTIPSAVQDRLNINYDGTDFIMFKTDGGFCKSEVIIRRGIDPQARKPEQVF